MQMVTVEDVAGMYYSDLMMVTPTQTLQCNDGTYELVSSGETSEPSTFNFDFSGLDLGWETGWCEAAGNTVFCDDINYDLGF